MTSREKEKRPVEEVQRGDRCDGRSELVCVFATHCRSAGSGRLPSLLLFGLRLLIGSQRGSLLLGLT